MKMRTGTILAAAAMAVAALSATVTGCELISSVDRSLIKAGAGGSGGSGGATATSTSSGSTGGTTSSSSGTGGSMCTDPVKDCPAPANECVTAVCDGGGLCAVKNVPDGTAVATQVPSDCKKVVCDGAGMTKSTNDNADVKDDGLECTTDSCAAGVEVHAPVAANTMCGMAGGTLKCDGAGACVGCVVAADCGATAACKLNTCMAGVCGTGNVPDATVCSDANACTTIDTCQAGTCTGANPIVCAAMDQCHVVGTCNTATGVCTNPTQGNGTACADGNNCTTGDTCQAGACAGAPVVCTPQDTCHGIGTCNAGTGVCSNPAKGDGAACNDANLCTTTDVCTAGSCAGASTVVCMPLDQCHVAGSCAPATGVCSNPNKADGTACVGGTLNVCTAGICT